LPNLIIPGRNEKTFFTTEKTEHAENALLKGIFRMERLNVKLPDKNPEGIECE